MPRIVFIWHAAVFAGYRKLLEELQTVSGADLHLIVPPHWPEAGMDLSVPAGTRHGYCTHVLRTWFIGRHYLYFMPGLARTLRRLRPQIVYCYAGPYWVITFWALWIVRRYLPDTRVVFVSDQTLYKEYPFPFSRLEAWVLRHADFATSCDFEGVERLWQKGFPSERTLAVPLGFDSTVFYPSGTGRVASRSLRILYAGRLIPMKGVRDLLDACALLEEPYELAIVGDGPERASLEQRALQLGIHALFHGTQSAGCVADLMRHSHVLVLPSRTIAGKWKEQFGRVLVEAMACGCVPVGSDSGAIPSVIGPAGLIFPEGEVAALEAALSSVAGDPANLQRLRERALMRASECYSWGAVARLLWTTLTQVLHMEPRRL